MIKQWWYGPRTTIRVVSDGYGGAVVLDGPEACRDWIRQADEAVYYTDNNEVGRGVYGYVMPCGQYRWF